MEIDEGGAPAPSSSSGGGNEELALPPVDEELLSKVKELGFEEVRARKALMSGANNVEAALQWCLDHAEDADIDDPIALVPKGRAPKVARSIKCVATGRLFRSMEEAQAYAEKTGRTDFEECEEEKKLLTEEEKAKKVAELKALAAKRRAEREGVEKVEDIDREKQRREQGHKAGETREQLEKAQRLREIDRVKREKLAEKRERERLRAEIAKDKAERRARGGKLAGKLGVDGYQPAVDQNDDRRQLDVSKLNQGKIVPKGGDDAESPAVKIDKAIATLSKYKVGGAGGIALKTLAAYLKNAIEKGESDPKFLLVPTDGKAFRERLSQLVGSHALLKAVGFEKTDAGLQLTLETRESNLPLLKDTLAKLQQAHAAYLAQNSR
ncbi:hypothetical protein CTAYLR_000282 [Chrysophaeum taylorii]|uniref:UBA domain-containing protein n=1 Tax=Chrysophaeum taylorii TaxID=2483200 RepID=A0AAD7UEN8_9STRA|nr:hypothetical protein CTAYLR_000282 [Chrysophaeum taylorii]